jgi:transcriptional regulator with XRE-family HTH domain
MPRHPLTSALAQNLRRFREDAGLTQLQLAEAADVADATISRIERGRLAPSAALLAKLAGALRVSVDDLLGPPREQRKLALRAPIARLVAVVRDLDDGQVDDVTKAVKLLLAVGRRTGAPRASGRS